MEERKGPGIAEAILVLIVLIILLLIFKEGLVSRTGWILKRMLSGSL